MSPRTPSSYMLPRIISGPRMLERLHSLTETATRIVEVPLTLLVLPNTSTLKEFLRENRVLLYIGILDQPTEHRQTSAELSD